MQAERALEHAVHLGHGGDGLLDGGGEAGLGGDDEGQAVLGVAGALEDGVDVGADFGERAGDGGDDAGLVVDDEAEVVRGEEFAGDLAACGRGAGRRLEPCATARMSETTATAVGSPPAPWPEKTTSPPKRPLK